MKSQAKVVSLAAGIALLASACASSGGSPSTSASSGSGTGCPTGSGPIIIGNVTDLSGAQSPLGIGENQGVEVAVKMINSAGGLLDGRMVVVKKFDTETSPDKGVPQANAAVAAKPAAIIGGEISDTVIAATNISNRAGIAWITPGGTSAKITGRGMDTVFQTVASTDQSGQNYYDMLAFVAGKVGAGNKLSLSINDSTYGQSLTTAFKHANSSSSTFNIVEEVAYPIATPDLSAIAVRMAGAKPDILLNNGYPTDGLNLGRIFSEKVDTTAKIYASASTLGVIIKELGPKANGMITQAPVGPNLKGIPASFREFVDAYTAEFPGSQYNISSVQGYSAARFALEAIKAAGCDDPTAVKNALHKVVLTHLTGNVYPQDELSFGDNGAYKDPPFFFAQVQDSKPVVVWPASVALGNPVPYR